MPSLGEFSPRVPPPSPMPPCASRRSRWGKPFPPLPPYPLPSSLSANRLQHLLKHGAATCAAIAPIRLPKQPTRGKSSRHLSVFCSSLPSLPRGRGHACPACSGAAARTHAAPSGESVHPKRVCLVARARPPKAGVSRGSPSPPRPPHRRATPTPSRPTRLARGPLRTRSAADAVSCRGAARGRRGWRGRGSSRAFPPPRASAWAPRRSSSRCPCAARGH